MILDLGDEPSTTIPVVVVGIIISLLTARQKDTSLLSRQGTFGI